MKYMLIMNSTHPWTELLKWIEGGEYQAVLVVEVAIADPPEPLVWSLPSASNTTNKEI